MVNPSHTTRAKASHQPAMLLPPGILRSRDILPRAMPLRKATHRNLPTLNSPMYRPPIININSRQTLWPRFTHSLALALLSPPSRNQGSRIRRLIHSRRQPIRQPRFGSLPPPNRHILRIRHIREPHQPLRCLKQIPHKA